MTSLRLRPEARGFRFDELHPSQIDAAASLVQLLGAAFEADNHRNQQNPDLPEWIDQQRNARVAFLSGPRGSGKTSVVLSIISEASSINETLPNDRFSPHKELRATLAEFATHLVWLNPIDLDPLPTPTSFLAAVLVRLEQALGGGDASTPKGGQGDPMVELARLRRDATLAWDSNLALRRASLETDNYVAEAIRTEEARVNFPKRMRQLLRRLARFEGKQRQLFVLVIDDFDLDPAHAVEILRLLRTLPIPGLFTVMLGDLEIAQDMFGAKVAGGINEISKWTFRSGQYTDGFVHTSASEIAAQALRKMVPPAHRIYLGSLTAREAANFKPTPNNKTLETLLEDIKISSLATTHSVTHGGYSLRDFFLVKSPQLSSDKQPMLAFHGAELFASPARTVLDLWQAISRISPTSDQQNNTEHSQKPRKLIALLAREFRRATMEEPALSSSAKHALLNSVTYDPLSDEWDISTSNIQLRRSLSRGRMFYVNPSYNSWPIARYGVKIRRLLHWEMRVDTRPLRRTAKSSMARPQAISRRTIAALIALRDIMVLTESGIVENMVEDKALRERAITEWEDSGSEPISIPWFGDVWETFWSADRFAGRWNFIKRRVLEFEKAASEQVNSSIQIALMGYAWIAAGLDVLSGAGLENMKNDEELIAWLRDGEPQAPQRWKTILAKADQLDWEPGQALFKRITNLRPPSPGVSSSRIQRDEINSWLVGLGCLLAPEIGLPDVVFNWIMPRKENLASPASQTYQNIEMLFAPHHRKIAQTRAKRMEHQLLRPLALAMVNPHLGEHIAQHLTETASKDGFTPLSSHPFVTIKEWKVATARVAEELRKHCEILKCHPINKSAVHILRPDIRTILNVLHGLPLREDWLTLEEAVLYHALRSVSDPELSGSSPSGESPALLPASQHTENPPGLSPDSSYPAPETARAPYSPNPAPAVQKPPDPFFP